MALEKIKVNIKLKIKEEKDIFRILIIQRVQGEKISFWRRFLACSTDELILNKKDFKKVPSKRDIRELIEKR